MKNSASMNRPRRIALAAGLAVLCVLGACATAQPVVYQKEKALASTVPSERLATDVQACKKRAAASVGLNARSGSQVAQASARTGAIGFVGTAIGALVNSSKDAWQRARAGAAAGAAGMATKAILEWNDPDEVYQEYVERCLGERGHDVLGWR